MITTPNDKLKSTPLLILMAKAPRSGHCNTRLAPRLGLRGAARLQARLLQQRIRLLAPLAIQVELHASPDIRHPLFLAARRQGLRVKRQASGHLGRRMQRAQAHRKAVFIGSDCPSLSHAQLHDAIRLLNHDQATCIPALDGGYVLLGLPYGLPTALQAIAWGSAQVLVQTRRQLRRRGLKLCELPPLRDLDTPRDFHQLRRTGTISAFGRLP